MNVVERQRFQSGEKLIAILSDAGATGFSLHADKTQPNQRRRLHIVPELGWSASKIVQQFGRTHRTNQLMPPEYILLTCECAGESLTGSAVARKLEGLGALTKGDKTAGRGETAGSLGTNLETSVGLDALKQLRYRRKDPLSFSVENVDEIFVLSGTSLELTSKQYQVLYNIKTVKVFLTRLQLLPVGHQQAMLRFFLSKMRQTDNAMALQSESNSVKVARETVVFQNPANTAEKVTVTEIECDHSCSWQTASDLAVAGGGLNNILDPRLLVGFFCNRGDPAYQIFLVLPVDAARVKVVFPFRFSGGFYPLVTLSLIASSSSIQCESVECGSSPSRRPWRRARISSALLSSTDPSSPSGTTCARRSTRSSTLITRAPAPCGRSSLTPPPPADAALAAVGLGGGAIRSSLTSRSSC